MCFEVIRQGDMPEVLPAMEAIQLFPPDSTSNWNQTMTELYRKYGVIGGPQVCILMICALILITTFCKTQDLGYDFVTWCTSSSSKTVGMHTGDF